jgi:hypothetical protein
MMRLFLFLFFVCVVDMFKVRMQNQYAAATDKRLSVVARETWQQWASERCDERVLGDGYERDTGLCWVRIISFSAIPSF